MSAIFCPACGHRHLEANRDHHCRRGCPKAMAKLAKGAKT
jgi:hypothetical protein